MFHPSDLLDFYVVVIADCYHCSYLYLPDQHYSAVAGSAGAQGSTWGWSYHCSSLGQSLSHPKLGFAVGTGSSHSLGPEQGTKSDINIHNYAK